MQFIDFHTHQASKESELVVQDGTDTWGIHPWQASLSFDIPDLSNRLAIGECGLDRLCATPFEVQLAVFQQQIQLSEALRKPLVVHCVKTLEDILRLHRQMHATQPWILHGFRGKPQQLQSLLSVGCHISFGFRFNPESLLRCPLDRLLLETDEDKRPVAELYQSVATLLGLPLERLTSQMHTNYLTLFGTNAK